VEKENFLPVRFLQKMSGVLPPAFDTNEHIRRHKKTTLLLQDG